MTRLHSGRGKETAGAVAISLYLIWVGTASAGDPAKGERRHEACLQCHGTELYVPPQAKIESLRALRKEVQRWTDYYNPRFSNQEIDDLVAFLNRDFYKFEERK